MYSSLQKKTRIYFSATLPYSLGKALITIKDEDGDGGAHLHGRTAGRGVVGDLVAHDC